MLKKQHILTQSQPRVMIAAKPKSFDPFNSKLKSSSSVFTRGGTTASAVAYNGGRDKHDLKGIKRKSSKKQKNNYRVNNVNMVGHGVKSANQFHASQSSNNTYGAIANKISITKTRKIGGSIDR